MSVKKAAVAFRHADFCDHSQNIDRTREVIAASPDKHDRAIDKCDGLRASNQIELSSKCVEASEMIGGTLSSEP
jgi:hypothetical protein